MNPNIVGGIVMAVIVGPLLAALGYSVWYGRKHGWKAATPVDSWLIAKMDSDLRQLTTTSRR